MARTTPVHAGYTIINGAGTGTNGNRIDVWAEYRITGQDSVKNTSALSVYFYAALNSFYTSTTQNQTGLNSALQVGGMAGTGVQAGAYDFTSASKINLLGSFTGSIPHNIDGSKTISVSGSFSTKSTYISGGAVSGSIALPQIPRASAVGATAAHIGQTSMIAIASKSSAYTHTLAYRFGGLTGFIDGDGHTVTQAVKFSNTAVAFPIPEDFYAQIPNAVTGECVLTCTTYSGNTQIGQPQSAAFTVSAKNAVPSVSGTVEDVNPVTLALTEDASMLVQYHSTARCTLTAQAQKSATVKEKTVAGIKITEDALDISQMDLTQIPFGVKDSRGLSAQAVVTPRVVPYTHLTANITVRRDDPTALTATVTLSGSFFAGSFGSRDNALSVTYALSGGEPISAPVTLVTENGRYAGSFVVNDLSYTQSHNIQVCVSDALERISRDLTVHKGIPVFDWGEGDFRFHVPVTCTSLNGLYMDSVRIWGEKTFTLKTRFDTVGESGARQSIFLFGLSNNTPIMGVILIRSDGITQWHGSEGVVVAPMDESGCITVTLPNIAYDILTLISAYEFKKG